MEVARTAEGGLFLSQHRYVEDVLQRFRINTGESGEIRVNGANTPMDHHTRLVKEGVVTNEKGPDGHPVVADSTKVTPDTPYRGVVGALLWLAMGTRPDIAYAVTQVAKYGTDPRVAHWNACKRILRYLSVTRDYGIHYHKPNTLGPKPCVNDVNMPSGYFRGYQPEKLVAQLSLYVDADFANNLDTRHSVSGFAFFLCDGPVTWQSRTQPTVALSSMESEYMAASAATQEALWLRMILEELGVSLDRPLVLHEDNKACIAFSKNPGDFKRTKHIDYRHHFVRERVASGDIALEYIQTDDQIADIFTKALDPVKFCYFRDRLVVRRGTLNIVPNVR
jgi:hypothetical protein